MAAAKKTAESKPKAGQVVVSAPLVQVNTADGKVLHLYKGDIVPSSASDESVDHLKSLGFVGDADAAEAADGDN